MKLLPQKDFGGWGSSALEPVRLVGDPSELREAGVPRQRPDGWRGACCTCLRDAGQGSQGTWDWTRALRGLLMGGGWWRHRFLPTSKPLPKQTCIRPRKVQLEELRLPCRAGLGILAGVFSNNRYPDASVPGEVLDLVR